MEVLGVGEVKLTVKTDLNGSLNDIVLKDVLHVPSMACNIVGLPITKHGWPITSFGGEPGEEGIVGARMKNRNGDCGALLTEPPYKFILKDGTPGRFNLEKDGIYMFRIGWDDKERERFARYTVLSRLASEFQRAASRELRGPVGGSGGSVEEEEPEPPYTEKEKEWLKNHWKSEYHFLQAYQLGIHDEEHREEGRKIVRAFMKHDP